MKTTLRERFYEKVPRLAEQVEGPGNENNGADTDWLEYGEALGEVAESSDLGESDFEDRAPGGKEPPEPGKGSDLEGLVRRMPPLPDLEREDERSREFFLLDLPASSIGGTPDTVEIRVDAGQTVFATFGPDGVCERRFAIDSGWGVCCRYPISSDGRIIRLKRSGEIEAALCGRLFAYGDPVDTSELTAFLDTHVARIVAFGLDMTVGTALRYREVVLRGPEWLRPAMEGSRVLLPHLRIAEGV